MPAPSFPFLLRETEHPNWFGHWVTMLVVTLQPDGCCREQEGCCDPRPVPPAQGLQEDPRQVRLFALAVQI